MTELTVGSLFTGIGGLDLGLERAGMTVRWQCENDPYCVRVLKKHWPEVPNLGDVTNVDWSEVEHVDVICGGYPCQPFSFAGTRRGTADSRHLWPHMRDAISVLRPRHALLENVPGHVGLGFDRVLADLTDLGYDTEWSLVPAAVVGAPHLRYRLFVVAHPNGESESGVSVDAVTRSRVVVPVADADGTSRHATRTASQTVLRSGTFERSGRRNGGDGDHWSVEPDVGRVAHGIPARMDRLRALGNAVVPQVAELVAHRIIRGEAG